VLRKGPLQKRALLDVVEVGQKGVETKGAATPIRKGSLLRKKEFKQGLAWMEDLSTNAEGASPVHVDSKWWKAP
jgi:hypothetical protein